MKKLFFAVMMVSMFASTSGAAERKPINAVDIDAIANDTNVAFKGAGDNHLAIAWWIPIEHWQAILARDATTSDSDKKAMLDALEGVSLLAVVQADISALGGLKFYTREEVEKNLIVSYSGSDGKSQRLLPMQALDADLEVVLGILKPTLGAAMGNLGSNMHFFVLHDRSKSGPRLIDPYRIGLIGIQAAKRDKGTIDASIEMPINELFVPRKCPNGKDAHVSWRFCPWSGEKLED